MVGMSHKLSHVMTHDHQHGVLTSSSILHLFPQDVQVHRIAHITKAQSAKIAITVAAQSRQQTGISNMIMTVSLKLHYIRVATLHTCADQIHEFKYFLASLIFHFLGHCHLLALPPRLLLCL